MKILLIAFLAIFATAESLQCEPNSIFKNDCNTCRCSRNGEYALCTLKACINFSDSSNTSTTRKSESTEVTEETTIFPTEQYQTTEYDDEAVQFPDFLCTEVKSFKHYCNLCTCEAVGKRPSCTMAGCSSKYWNKDGTMKYDLPEEFTIQPLEELYTTPIVSDETEEKKPEN